MFKVYTLWSDWYILPNFKGTYTWFVFSVTSICHDSLILGKHVCYCKLLIIIKQWPNVHVLFNYSKLQKVDSWPFKSNSPWRGHFRITLSLASLIDSWCSSFHIREFIHMQIKLIFICWIVVHKALFW